MHPMVKETGQQATVSYEKMSKSKYNGVDPQAVVDRYGADCTRLHMLVKAPPTEVLEWEEHSIVGMQRWLSRMTSLARQLSISSDGGSSGPLPPDACLPVQGMSPADRTLYRHTHQAIEEVTAAFERLTAFNVAVSTLIKLYNSVMTEGTSNEMRRYTLDRLLRMLAPMAPAISEELWATLHHPDPVSIFQIGWPAVDPKALEVDEALCVVQASVTPMVAVPLLQ